MDKAKAIDVLFEAHSLLRSINVDSWLTDGTLLGYYREGDFISHDIDVDLGVRSVQWSPKILTLMESNDFETIRQEGTIDNGLEYSFVKDGVCIDFFFFYSDGHRVWHSAWLKGLQLKFYYPDFALKEIEFLGKKFKVPEDEEVFLKLKYGGGWRVPVVKWHWAFSPCNVELGMPSTLNKIRLFHQWGRWRVKMFKKWYRKFKSSSK